ncbi:hypothetical protein O7622_12765 [Micromonospora sp. WMMD1076]|uniref:hypothetical protein n=1 Tax=Micromonospora sp. WMMD1076 TaxID=3016103 RepID=UPI00249B4424|nr:hypothetical protein [Micromonospora sp. WMMD1076]WFF09361.1 hypothetical protein O7622_12765 [Micromonospora sp. WMMD1076]
MRGLLGDVDELEWLAFGQAGVVTTAQVTGLLAEGAVRGLVRSGRWRSLCRGLLLTGNGRLTRDQQLWVAVLATGPGAVLAGVTAAAEGGVRGLRPDPLHVLVPAARRAGRNLGGLPLDMPGVVVHRTTALPAEHRQRARPPRTTTARSVVDAASWATSAREAQLVLAAACQQRRVTPSEIGQVLALMPRVRRRQLIRQAVADIAGGAEALSELDFVRLCERHGLPRPDLQHPRRDAEGRRRWLDAYWREWRLHAEVDGAHHMDARQWADDMRRQNAVWTEGDRILRFPAWLVRARPDEVAGTLRRALLAAGWRPTC